MPGLYAPSLRATSAFIAVARSHEKAQQANSCQLAEVLLIGFSY